MKKILIFASGSGSNAENIIVHFKEKEIATIEAVLTNNPNAKVIERANKLKIPTVVFNKKELLDGSVLEQIKKLQPDLIILAGFLLKFPEDIIHNYPNKIINIHPSLLPNYGGKGMYGMHVHQAVFDAKEQETGITIHFVNEHYDEGKFIFQEKTSILDCKSPEDIAHKIHLLEMEHFPKVIEGLLTSFEF